MNVIEIWFEITWSAGINKSQWNSIRHDTLLSFFSYFSIGHVARMKLFLFIFLIFSSYCTNKTGKFLRNKQVINSNLLTQIRNFIFIFFNFSDLIVSKTTINKLYQFIWFFASKRTWLRTIWTCNHSLNLFILDVHF